MTVPSGTTLKIQRFKDSKTKITLKTQITVFLNGNISGLMRINNYNLNVMQTCAFDSIFQVVISGLLANRIYHENVQSSDCPIINLAQNVNKKKHNKKGLCFKSQDITNNFNFLKCCHDLHDEHKTS